MLAQRLFHSTKRLYGDNDGRIAPIGCSDQQTVATRPVYRSVELAAMQQTRPWAGLPTFIESNSLDRRIVQSHERRKPR
jgi:hypothetical protein